MNSSRSMLIGIKVSMFCVIGRFQYKEEDMTVRNQFAGVIFQCEGTKCEMILGSGSK